MSTCLKCQKELKPDEIAIYRRLVSRAATEYLCIDCLAQYFKCDRQMILDRIDYFRSMGCTLFSPKKSSK